MDPDAALCFLNRCFERSIGEVLQIADQYWSARSLPWLGGLNAFHIFNGRDQAGPLTRVLRLTRHPANG